MRVTVHLSLLALSRMAAMYRPRCHDTTNNNNSKDTVSLTFICAFAVLYLKQVENYNGYRITDNYIYSLIRLELMLPECVVSECDIRVSTAYK